MEKNKKIRNATVTKIGDITFKSKLEGTLYQALRQAGFSPEYETRRFILMDGFKPTVPFYNRSKSKIFRLDNSKVRDITYTPDFTFLYEGTLVIIEVKGIENDVFPIKKKLFRKLLERLSEELKIPCMYFEVRTKKELLQTIEIIKSYVPKTAFGNNKELDCQSSRKRQSSCRKISRRKKV